jgi:predicted Na+-dependent transporter
MTLARIAILSLQVSVFLIVFSLGLAATWASATSLFRRPALLLRSFLSVNLVMPLFAAAIAAFFHFSPAVKIALIFLAISPLPPLLPQKQLKLGGRADYVYGLFTGLSVLSIFVVPVAVEILGMVFGRDIHVGPLLVAEVVFRTILLPIGLGMLVHRWAPGLAQKISVKTGKLGNLLMLMSLVPLLIVSWRQAMSLISHGDLLAMILFTAVGLLVGHWLGPDPAERKTLALATALHHPGLAIAIAAATFPAQRSLVMAAVVLYLLVSFLVLLPYNAWWKRRMTGEAQRAVSQRRAA